ncbi:MAG: peptidase domain-containing ABC transporter, partial [Chloroflexi bacterium]|nr:peptidase domain-containing ABC transporter [Chloroflexota bacterium]
DINLTLGFVNHLVDLPYAFFLRRSAGDLMMRLRSNAIVRELLTVGSMTVLLDGLMTCLYLILLLVLSWQMGLLVLGLGGLQVLVLLLARRRTQQLMSESLEIEARSQSYLYQVLNGIQALKASGGEQRAVEQWSGLFNSEINVALARGRLNALIDTLMSGLRLGAPLLILAFGAAQVLAGDLTLGTMLALGALAAGFLEPLSQLVTVGLQAQSIGSYMERINDVLDTPKEQPGDDVQPAGRLSGHIAAEQVAFGYSADAAPVIDGVSLEILPGQKVAIVGRSGSGKSTLAHLLLGLFTPQRGRILYDGVDLAALEVRSVRQQIGIVTQSSYLFGTTIRENISLVNPLLPLSAIERAARIASIHDDIAALPLGYDTFIGDGGVTLSGGQRQRLALARALVNEPKILLLDEATSALDAVTEREVFENLAALDCTVVVIAHRLSTIADADQILLVEQGKVVERGTHDQLLALGSRYQTFVAYQHRPASAALS